VTAVRAVPFALTTVVALSLWLGAATLVATVVAPAAFAVLPTRTLAGALVGRVLPVLFWSGLLVGLAVAILARGDAAGVRRLAGVAMMLGCLAAQLAVGPRIARIRAEAGQAIDQLSRDDPRRVAFGRLHGASVGLLGVAALAGATALLFTLRALQQASADGRLSHLSHEL
jgi:hypothetical protein